MQEASVVLDPGFHRDDGIAGILYRQVAYNWHYYICGSMMEPSVGGRPYHASGHGVRVTFAAKRIDKGGIIQ